jgi:hypothetical protein
MKRPLYALVDPPGRFDTHVTAVAGITELAASQTTAYIHRNTSTTLIAPVAGQAIITRP